MDRDERIEVKVMEPVVEIPISERERSTKTLSTIPECESSKVSHNLKEEAPRSINSKSNVDSLSAAKERIESLENSNTPHDIDLLLKRYACNSNMARSIKEIFGKTDDPVSEETKQGPLLELGAAHKIFTFLKDRSSSSKHSLLSTLRFRDTLTKLEHLTRGCSKETLQEFLSIDPSMRMCEHCGVISCERSSNISVESRRSSPKTSYFLSTKVLSDIVKNGDDKLVTRRRARRISSKKERAMRRAGNDVQRNANPCPSRELSLNVDREKKSRNGPQNIEIMAAERESDGETRGINETELQSHLGTTHRLKIISNSEANDEAKNDAIVNVKNNLLYDSYVNRVNYTNEFIHCAPNDKLIKQEALSNSPLSVHKSDEKIVKDILYENSGLHLNDYKFMSSSKNRDRSSNILANDSLNYLEQCKYMEPKDVQQLSSLPYLIEDDSLENCVKVSGTLQQLNESNTTVCSSSSAENMIRKWIKVPESRTKNDILSTDEKQRSLQVRSSVFSKNYPNEQAVSDVVNGFKFWNSQESIKNETNAQGSNDVEIRGSKKSFTKHLFGCFKSLVSTRSIKSKEIDSSAKPRQPKNISRRIIYKESSFKDALNGNENCNKVNGILLLYRKILEGTEGMDWQSFQRFVECIHPSHIDSWRDICKSINDNAKRMADENGGGTEICIEISSVTSEGLKRETETCSGEIVFEMDITLGDVERCLRSQRAFSEKEQLDGLKSASGLAKV